MPTFFLITEDGAEEGPYTDVELLDLLDRKLILPTDQCVEQLGSEIMEVQDLFEVFEPESDAGEGEDEEADSGEEPSTEEDSAETATSPPARASADDEELFSCHPSILLFIQPLLGVVSLAVVGVFVMNSSPWTSIVIWSACLIMLGLILFLRARHSYIVTKTRVEMITGIILRSSREVRIVDIRTINVIRQGLRGYLGVGTVEFSSAGSSDGEVQFKNIRRCQSLKNLVRSLQKSK